MRALTTALIGAAVLGGSIFHVAPAAAQEAAPPGSDYDGPAFTFHRIQDDIYLAVGTGNLQVMSNAAVIINEEDVLLVDSHVSPAAAHALLEELAQVTAKPVRYVVNSHFHFDHAHGNQVYPSTVEVIGHEYTHRMLASGASNRGRTPQRFLGGLPQQIEALRAQLDTASTAEGRAAIERRLRIQENFLEATDAVVPTAPTVTMNERLTLHRGGREIRLEFFGRGHTGGDVVVYLPAERIIVTGDLLLAGLPYMGDAYIPDWIETLERLKELDFDTVMPGHGMAFTELERIDHLQEYLADLWGQVSALHAAGASVQEAAERIDMRAHATNYPSIRSPGLMVEAVEAAYEVLSGVR
jgi:cyclase